MTRVDTRPCLLDATHSTLPPAFPCKHYRNSMPPPPPPSRVVQFGRTSGKYRLLWSQHLVLLRRSEMCSAGKSRRLRVPLRLCGLVFDRDGYCCCCWMQEHHWQQRELCVFQPWSPSPSLEIPPHRYRQPCERQSAGRCKGTGGIQTAARIMNMSS